jgi:hypothetical protein
MPVALARAGFPAPQFGAPTPARFANLACAQLKAQWFDTPLEYPEGTVRSYVRRLTASIEPEATKP